MIKVGDIIETNKCGKAKILENCGNSKYTIVFLETGYIKEKVSAQSIGAGSIKDPLAKTVLGIACLGEKYNSKHILYSRWSTILKRCYNENTDSYPKYGGKGVRVSDEWLNFSTFCDDIATIPNWEEKIKQGYQFDKDKLGDGLLYSKETVDLISPLENLKLREFSKGVGRGKKIEVIKTDSDGKIIEVYPSMKAASETIGLTYDMIKRLPPQGRLHNGFIYKKKEEK